MSNLIAWIAAEAEGPEDDSSAGLPRRTRHGDEQPTAEDFATRHLPEHLPAHQFPEHQFPAQQFPAQATEPELETTESISFHQRLEEEEDRERLRRTYRGRVVAMLRRYMQYSIETGRLPSLLGREFFRAKVTSYTVVTFEDRVIFVHDMEKCLDRLDEFSRQIIARHILQEHDQEATAKLLHCAERTVRTYVPAVLDLLTEILLEKGLMKRLALDPRNSCQGGENDEIASSDCEDGKYKV